MQNSNTEKKQRKHRAAAPIAALFVILAIIGAVTVIVYSIQLTASFLDNDSEKKKFEDIIRPLVMFNPVPFENPADIEMVNLLQYSMWSCLTSEKRSSYQSEGNFELRVPASDLDVAATRLFGPDFQLVHQSFGNDSETRYYFDDKEMVYNVPVTAMLMVYSPKVVEIERDKEDPELYNLQVAYIPPASPLTTDYSAGETTPRPDKYMIYVMRKAGDSYQIAKVQDPPPELLESFGNQPTAAAAG